MEHGKTPFNDELASYSGQILWAGWWLHRFQRRPPNRGCSTTLAFSKSGSFPCPNLKRMPHTRQKSVSGTLASGYASPSLHWFQYVCDKGHSGTVLATVFITLVHETSERCKMAVPIAVPACLLWQLLPQCHPLKYGWRTVRAPSPTRRNDSATGQGQASALLMQG